MKSTLLTGLFVFILGLLLAGPVTFAQGVGSSGGIRGTLTDPAGVAVSYPKQPSLLRMPRRASAGLR